MGWVRKRHVKQRVRSAVRAAGVVASSLVLASGCSSSDPEQTKAWQRDYCGALGSWQDERAAEDSTSNQRKRPEPGSSGDQAIHLSKVLDREGLEYAGGHILGDTARAVVDQDATAEARDVRYCDHAGFETLVRSAGG